MIISARYTEADHVQIRLMLDTGYDAFMPLYPSNTNMDMDMKIFLEDGGVIEDYDEYWNVSDVELQDIKYQLNAELANVEIQAAETVPIQGPTLTPRKRDKENLRRNNRAKRNNKMTDADDIMANYVDSVMDVLDNADNEVENLVRLELEAWDGSTIVWPIWEPPV